MRTAQVRARRAIAVAAGLALASAGGLMLAQNTAPLAGAIATMVPVANVERSAPQAQTIAAKSGLEIHWGDKIKTERGGRVRVRLTDGSVLNVGSQSELLVKKHDAQEQNTELDLLYGRIRTNATRIVKPTGQFKVRTRAATAGVVGTEKYVEANNVDTTVIAMGGGNVVVSSNDSRYPDPVVLVPGETVTMTVGRPPGQKRQATAEEMSRAASETESDAVIQITPNQSTAGAQFEATLSGRGLERATNITFANSNIRVISRGAASGGGIPVRIEVASSVPPGSYGFTVERPEGTARGTLIVRSSETPVAAVNLPSAMGPGSAPRGAKLSFDASGVQAPAGGQIVRYEWRVLNTQVRSNDATFQLNTSLLAPGNYVVELSVTTDRGQTASQRYNLSVQAGTQPAEILRALATAYESLQPNEFLRYFDDQKFRNFAGFAGAIEDSFRNQLETMRVFQRAVNCQVSEEQDQAVCQADLELRFTKKDQQLQLLDPQGNVVPAGATAPPGSTLGKAIQTGFERTTLRYERGEQGWRIVDYGSVVSCPGGGSTSGISVGSCVFAVASAATPSFQLVNLQLSSNNISLGGVINGAVEVLAVSGYTGQVNLTGQAQVGGQPFAVSFSANPATPGRPVTFTVTAPTTPPAGFTGPTNFTLVITGQDTAGSLSATVNAPLTLQPGYTLSVSPATTSGAPLSVTHNSTTNLQVSISGGSGFTGSVLVDFPNLPAGFQATPGNVAAGSTASFPLTVTPGASPGPALITVRAASATAVVQTVPVFAVVASDFTLTASSPTNFVTSPGGSLSITVNVVPISGFAGTVLVDFLNLPAGFTPVPTSAQVVAGNNASFTIGVAPTVPIGGISLTVKGTFLSAVRTLAIAGNVQSAPPKATGSGTVAPPVMPAGGGTSSAPRATLPTAPSSTTSASSTTSTTTAPDPLAGNPLAPQPTSTLPGSTSTSTKGGTTAPAGAATSAVRIDRARIRIEAGTCTGFRIASAGQQACGGTSDFELTATANGDVTLEADGVAPIGLVALDRVQAPASSPNLSRNLGVQSGTTYLVQSKNAMYAVKLTFGRPVGGTRGRVGAVRQNEEQSAASGASMVVSLEWRTLP